MTYDYVLGISLTSFSGTRKMERTIDLPASYIGAYKLWNLVVFKTSGLRDTNLLGQLVELKRTTSNVDWTKG